MIGLIKKRLESLEKPVDLVLVGLGFMGYGFLRRVMHTPGLRIPLVISRSLERTASFLKAKGLEVCITGDPAIIGKNAEDNIVSLCEDYRIIHALPYQIVVEMTGDVVYGAQVALEACKAGKHLATMNAELHATVGSQILNCANEQGCLVTDLEGDQPGSLATLTGYAELMGFKPLMAGNIKGFLNRCATPESIRDEAVKRGLSPDRATSFADGTKLALEMTLVANYLGMKAARVGMNGPCVEKLEEVLSLFEWDAVPREGWVDYVIGGSLPPGIFLVCEHEDPEQASYLRYLKFGEGPQYLIHKPFHLCHFESILSIARLAFFGEVTINNMTQPTTQTTAHAKKALRPGDVLDGIGGYCCYGLIQNIDAADAQGAVPIGMVKDGVVRQPIAQDDSILADQIELPDNAATKLWRNCSSS